MKLRQKRYPLDIFLISGHMHMGAGASWSLMRLVRDYPAVRRYGMASYRRGGSYDKQALEYLREGRVNTIFIDPGNTGDPFGFDAADFIPAVLADYPNVAFVLYTWRDCFERFTQIHPRFKDYFYLPHLAIEEGSKHPKSETLNGILTRCETWHETRFQYDVAISFAGEERPQAKGITAKLKAVGARVFFDSDEQADLLGKDLYTHLADVYSRKARYCVMLLSKSYATKMWTSHERRSAQERALRERGNEFILPVRIDDTAIPGVPTTIGFIKVSDGLERVARTIAEKLWVTDPDKPKEYIGESLY